MVPTIYSIITRGCAAFCEGWQSANDDFQEWENNRRRWPEGMNNRNPDTPNCIQSWMED